MAETKNEEIDYSKLRQEFKTTEEAVDFAVKY
jgi:hypothetical protein